LEKNSKPKHRLGSLRLDGVQKYILKQKRVGRPKIIQRWEDLEDRGKVYETRKAQGDVYI
jgi:hypothetical protein